MRILVETRWRKVFCDAGRDNEGARQSGWAEKRNDEEPEWLSIPGDNLLLVAYSLE